MKTIKLSILNLFYSFAIIIFMVLGFTSEVFGQHTGIVVEQAPLQGLRIDSTGGAGVLIQRTATSAIEIQNAGEDGVNIFKPADDGIQINDAGGAGVRIQQTVSSAIEIQNAGEDGVNIFKPSDDGVQITDAGSAGVRIDSSTGEGLTISRTAQNGIGIRNPVLDGVFVFEAGSTGVNIDSAGVYGIYVTRTASRGISVEHTGNEGIVIYKTGAQGLRIDQSGQDAIRIDSAADYGIYVQKTGNDAAYFDGDITITGSISKGSGTFKIDHPTDPENKYLYHSFVESPDMMNVYNGNTTIDESGNAVVELPEWFEALNREFRYQLTCIGGFAPVYVAQEIKNNHFSISGGKPGMKVSWQVTGIRHDKFSEKNRVEVEKEKPDHEKGFYLHPEAFNQPPTRSVRHTKKK